MGAGVTTLRLQGPDDALRGTMETNFMGNVQDSQVRGSYQDGVLLFEDVDRGPSYAGSYRATVSAVGRLEGQCTTFLDKRVSSFSFARP